MMTETPSGSSWSRFSCTQCGKCCNRSPEVELSEAAALADTFVFRLMFRVYWLPQQFITPQGAGNSPLNSSSAFYERKRLFTAFAAHKASLKAKRDRKGLASTRYLMISALALDTNSGECGALQPVRQPVVAGSREQPADQHRSRVTSANARKQYIPIM